jgi:hypothetical protein
MKIIFTAILVAFSFSASSQQTVLTGGGDASSTGGSISYSIGQVAYSNSIDGLVNEGVQQPFEIFTISVDNVFHDFQLNVYPNPASDELIIALKNFHAGVSAEILSADGKLIHAQFLRSGQTSVDVSSWAAATYIVRLTDEAGHAAAYQVIKH